MEWVWGRDYLCDWPMEHGGVFKKTHLKVTPALPFSQTNWAEIRHVSFSKNTANKTKAYTPALEMYINISITAVIFSQQK